MPPLISATWVVVSLAALEPRATWVDYRAPEECPSASTISDELAKRSSLIRVTTDEARATARVTLEVRKQGGRYEASLVVQTADGALNRKVLRGGRCETLTRAMTLTAALTLDPDGGGTKAPEAPVVTTPPPNAEPLEPLPRVVLRPTREPERTEAERSVHFDLSAGAWATSGVSGAFDFGGFASAMLGFGDAWRGHAALRLGGVSGRTVTADAGRIRYGGHLVGEVELGISRWWERLEVRVGAVAQLTPLVAEALDADTKLSSLRWLWAVGPSVGVRLALGSWRMGLRGEVPLALRQERYVLIPRGDVFSVPAVAFVGSLEVGWGW